MLSGSIDRILDLSRKNETTQNIDETKNMKRQRFYGDEADDLQSSILDYSQNNKRLKLNDPSPPYKGDSRVKNGVINGTSIHYDITSLPPEIICKAKNNEILSQIRQSLAFDSQLPINNGSEITSSISTSSDKNFNIHVKNEDILHSDIVKNDNTSPLSSKSPEQQYTEILRNSILASTLPHQSINTTGDTDATANALALNLLTQRILLQSAITNVSPSDLLLLSKEQNFLSKSKGLLSEGVPTSSSDNILDYNQQSPHKTSQGSTRQEIRTESHRFKRSPELAGNSHISGLNSLVSSISQNDLLPSTPEKDKSISSTKSSPKIHHFSQESFNNFLHLNNDKNKFHDHYNSSPSFPNKYSNTSTTVNNYRQKNVGITLRYEEPHEKQEFLLANNGFPREGGLRKNYKNMTRERRVEANARERNRVHTISTAFEHLRQVIPCYSRSQKLSKLAILKIAGAYMMSLARVLGKDLSFSDEAKQLDTEETFDYCTRIIQECSTKTPDRHVVKCIKGIIPEIQKS